MNKFILVTLTTFALASCGGGTSMEMAKSPEVIAVSGSRGAAEPALVVQKAPQRFTVTQVSTFQDEIAYGRKRGVYIIHDNTTGQEFVGVSGIGISELGHHQSGKTGISDER